MPQFVPFRGLRYHRDRISDLAQVVCPPYDVIGPQQQSALEAQSPYNTVRLELPKPANGADGYSVAAETLRSWQENGVLGRDVRPAYYLHETRFTFKGAASTRLDLIGSLRVEPWATGQVLPHERTMAGPKADRLQLLRATRANVSPIWVLFRDQPAPLAEAWTEASARAPEVDFNLGPESHRVWLLDDPVQVGAIQDAFAHGGPFYIADGHHRYETALAFQQETQADLPSAGGALAVATWAADPGLVVLPTHRLLGRAPSELTAEDFEARHLGGFDVEHEGIRHFDQPGDLDTLLDRLEARGLSAPTFGWIGPGNPTTFGTAQLRDRQLPGRILSGEHSEAWRELDVALLHEAILNPLLAEAGGAYEGALQYTRDPFEALTAIRSKSAAMAFFLNPTRTPQVLAVADAGDRMPEKSTYFYPKPPTGLVFRLLAAP